MTVASPLIESGEACRRLGFSQPYLAKLALNGGIPFEPGPRGRLYSVVDVGRLSAQRKGRVGLEALATGRHADALASFKAAALDLETIVELERNGAGA